MLKSAFATIAAIAVAIVASFACAEGAMAQTCASLPYTLVNGETADASQVMADFNCLKNSPAFVGSVGIGTSNPSGEAANAKLVIAGSPGQIANSLAQSNTNALLSLRGDINSGYTMAMGAGPGDLPYVQGVNFAGGAASANVLLNPFGGNVGIGTVNPYAESVNAKLAILGTPGQIATTLSQSNTNALLSIRPDSNSGYTMAIGAGPNDFPYIQGVNWNGGAAGANILLNPFGSYVGIGTTLPTAALQVQGSGTCIGGLRTSYSANGGRAFDVVQGTDNNLYFCYNGNAAASISMNGVYTQLSDARLKTNIGSLSDENGLAAIGRLRPVAYSFRREEKTSRHLGFIAQEVQQVFPELVATMALPAANGNDKGQVSDAKSVDYTGLIAPLVKAVQQLKAMNDAEEQEIQALKAQLAALKSGR